MANKTIGQLTSMTPSSTTELAIYDGSTTGKATVSDLLDTENLIYADDAMSPGSTAELDFESQDTSLTPSSTASVDLLQGTDGWSQRFVKISQMFKNIRWLFSKLGSTALGTTAQTITGAIAEHEQDISGLNSKFVSGGLFRIETISMEYSKPVSGAVGVMFTIPTKDDYTPVGIVGCYAGSNHVTIYELRLTSNTTARMMVQGDSSAATQPTAVIRVLYIRNS